LKTSTLSEPVLVGRDQELQELKLLFDSAAEGEGNTVFVSGEAGSGKTRLTSEFLKTAKKNGAVILFGACLSNAAAPYVPFVEAFKSYFSQQEESQRIKDDAAEVNAWLTGAKQAEQTGKNRSLEPQAWKDLTFAAVTKALSLISASKPLILLIEDLHWADSASLSLVHFVARTLKSEKILLLATFRSEELTTDAEGQVHPLAEELLMMRREGLFKEIRLSSLSPAYVTEIAENMVGGRVNPELAETLAKESRGNALFVVESLRMLFERGNLYQDDAQWRLTVDTLDIPDKIKDIILRRLSLLKFNQRRVLDAASVIGEKFDAELLSVVLAQDILDVLETLNAIARSTSLLRVEESFFRFDHAKSREAIYEDIALPLKRGYHSRVGEKLEQAGKNGRLPFSDIAYHYAQAGNAEKAIKFAMAAGQDALSRFSNAEAIKHLSYVLETLPDSPENAERRKDALEALGDAYYANCMFREALAVFERLAGSGTGRVRLRAYRKSMDAIFFGRGDPTRFMELAKKSEPYAAVDRLESARIRFHKASYLSRAESEIEWEASLRVFEEEYSLPDVARTLGALGIVKALIHPDGQGLTAILRSIQMFEELGDLHGVISSTQWAGVAFFGLNFLTEAAEMLTKAIQLGERIGAYNHLAMSSLYLGQVQEQLGLFEDAVSRNLKAVEYSEKAGRAASDLILASLVRQYARLDDSEAAEENYLKLVNSKPKPGPVDNTLLTREFYVARAQTAFFVLKNRWDEARQSLEKALAIGKKITGVSVFARGDYAWALGKQGRTEEARVQLEEARKITEATEKGFGKVNIEGSLMASWKVLAGEEFEMRLDLVNISKKPGVLVKADGMVPSEFMVVSSSADCSLENGSVDMKNRGIDPFKVETVKLKVKASKAGTFKIVPQVTIVDESGEESICRPNQITITVQPAQPKYETSPGRITTGYAELDVLLFGGIPEKYAIVLTSPSVEEREQLVGKFLEAGAKAGEASFHVTTEVDSAKTLAEQNPSSFFLFICNPQADAMVQSSPNIFKLKGVESLTEIDIALTKAFRTLPTPPSGSRRICIEIVSDALLQHHALITRKWLGGLLPTLKAKGFTILGVVDPQMHPPEEVQAIIGLFDGEMRVTERETVKGVEKALRVRKLSGQKYRDEELILNREKLEQ